MFAKLIPVNDLVHADWVELSIPDSSMNSFLTAFKAAPLNVGELMLLGYYDASNCRNPEMEVRLKKIKDNTYALLSWRISLFENALKRMKLHKKKLPDKYEHTFQYATKRRVYMVSDDEGIEVYKLYQTDMRMWQKPLKRNK